MAATVQRLRPAEAVSRRPGAFDLGHERVGQFDFGGSDSPPGNMNAKLGEPLDLTTQPLWKIRREQGRSDGDDKEASAGRAVPAVERRRVERPVRASESCRQK